MSYFGPDDNEVAEVEAAMELHKRIERLEKHVEIVHSFYRGICRAWEEQYYDMKAQRDRALAAEREKEKP